MAPGNTTQLSSNWKRLQETIAKERKTAPTKDKEVSKKENRTPQSSLKRKRTNEPERTPSVKRNKIELPGQRRNKIRMERSSEQNNLKLRKSKSTPHIKPTSTSADDELDEEEQERPLSSNGIQTTTVGS